MFDYSIKYKLPSSPEVREELMIEHPSHEEAKYYFKRNRPVAIVLSIALMDGTPNKPIELMTPNGKCPEAECSVLLCPPHGHKPGCYYMGTSILYRER